MREAQSPYLKDFLAYIAENPSIKPIKQFPARAAVKDKPPQFFRKLPMGDVIIYPKFLVFLTLEKCSPGNLLIFKEIIQETRSEFNLIFKINDIAENPLNLLKEIAQWISKKYQNKDVLEKALINSNSIFAPLDHDIVAVETGRFITQGCYIKILFQGRCVVICQEMEYKNPIGVFRSLIDWTTSKWNDDAVEHLRQFTKSNPHLLYSKV
jgi:hypothetical protein